MSPGAIFLLFAIAFCIGNSLKLDIDDGDLNLEYDKVLKSGTEYHERPRRSGSVIQILLMLQKSIVRSQSILYRELASVKDEVSKLGTSVFESIGSIKKEQKSQSEYFANEVKLLTEEQRSLKRTFNESISFVAEQQMVLENLIRTDTEHLHGHLEMQVSGVTKGQGEIKAQLSKVVKGQIGVKEDVAGNLKKTEIQLKNDIKNTNFENTLNFDKVFGKLTEIKNQGEVQGSAYTKKEMQERMERINFFKGVNNSLENIIMTVTSNKDSNEAVSEQLSGVENLVKANNNKTVDKIRSGFAEVNDIYSSLSKGISSQIAGVQDLLKKSAEHTLKKMNSRFAEVKEQQSSLSTEIDSISSQQTRIQDDITNVVSKTLVIENRSQKDLIRFPHFTTGTTEVDGKLELHVAGHIEILHDGRYGTICENGIDDNAANVLCKMAGYKGGVYDDGAYKQPTAQKSPQIWLDGLVCKSGDVDTIGQCQHKPWGVHSCDHSNDIGIKCFF